MIGKTTHVTERFKRRQWSKTVCSGKLKNLRLEVVEVLRLELSAMTFHLVLTNVASVDSY